MKSPGIIDGLIVALLISLAFASVYFLTPKMEYLPQGNRNLVLNILVPPPGLSTAERVDIGNRFHSMAAPHIGADVDGGNAVFGVGFEFPFDRGNSVRGHVDHLRDEAAVGSYGGSEGNRLFFRGEVKRAVHGITPALRR